MVEGEEAEQLTEKSILSSLKIKNDERIEEIHKVIKDLTVRNDMEDVEGMLKMGGIASCAEKIQINMQTNRANLIWQEIDEGLVNWEKTIHGGTLFFNECVICEREERGIEDAPPFCPNGNLYKRLRKEEETLNKENEEYVKKLVGNVGTELSVSIQ